MKKNVLVVILTVMIGGIFFCFSITHSIIKPPLDKKKAFRDIGEAIIRPAYQNFSDDCDALLVSYEAFKKNKSQENFEDLRLSWRKAQTAWQIAVVFNFEPIKKKDYIFNINFSPCRVNLIERVLAANETITEKDFETIGAAAKGLSTVEYFLYKPSMGNDVNLFLINEKEHAYFENLLKFTATSAKKLNLEWALNGNDFVTQISSASAKNIFYKNDQEVINDIVNSLLVAVEAICDRKIGKPLGKPSGETVRPEKCESPYSNTSLANIQANVKGIEALFTHTENRLLLIDILDSLNSEATKKIVLKLEAVNRELKNQTMPLEKMLSLNVKECNRLYELVVDLEKEIKSMVPVLGVRVRSSENDGD